MSYVDDIADKLAADVIDAQDRLGEERLFMEVAGELSAASTTLEEAFLTAVRVRLAERRARSYLVERLRRSSVGPDGEA